MKTLREVLESKLHEQRKPKKHRVYLSQGSIDDAESIAECSNFREVYVQFWASAAEKQYAYACFGQDGWCSNINCFDKEPPDDFREDVLRLRSELNFCEDCGHHKPNLDGWCGTCGSGY